MTAERESQSKSRSARRGVWVWVALGIAGCVVPPPAGTPVPPRVEVFTSDARAIRYGESATAILGSPAVRDKARALFGADWGEAGGRAGGLSAAAPEFFGRSTAPRVLRIGATEYVAVPGCLARACAARRGLLLIRADGEELLARLDDGGFMHHYGFGPGMTAMTPAHRLTVDAGWRALEQSAGWPGN